MTTKLVKARFSPSPTGQMHLGNARTALFSALLAYHYEGAFLLRIEDTDRERSTEDYTAGLYRDLRWLGLVWQEGPEVGGEAGPYLQSERLPIYQDCYDRLEAKGCAYPCFCSEEQLVLSRRQQRALGQAPRYLGTCRNLSKVEIDERLAKGMKPALRFRVPDDEEICFEDLVRGTQRFYSRDFGDFLIRKTDGMPTFMFCNVVDDAMMGVTYALRGEDHLSNTPRQLLIARALGLTSPTYGHISLIVGADGKPLSKRHGSKSVCELSQQGYFPLALLNYLARLGHSYANDALMSLPELARQFDTTRLSKSPARFDPQQLLTWQNTTVMAVSEDELWNWMNAETQSLVPVELRSNFIAAVRPNVTFPEDAQYWVKILFSQGLNYHEEASVQLKAAGRAFFEAALVALGQHGDDAAAVFAEMKTTLKIKGRDLYMPMRFALTGEGHGPEIAAIFHLIGVEGLQRRIRTVLDLVD